MKKQICLFIFLFYWMCSVGQVLGKSRMECRYEYCYSRDTTGGNMMHNELIVLQVGEKLSKSYNLATAEYDSLFCLPGWKKRLQIRTKVFMACAVEIFHTVRPIFWREITNNNL